MTLRENTMLVTETQTLSTPHFCDLAVTEACLTRIQGLKLEPQGSVEMLASLSDGA